MVLTYICECLVALVLRYYLDDQTPQTKHAPDPQRHSFSTLFICLSFFRVHLPFAPLRPYSYQKPLIPKCSYASDARAWRDMWLVHHDATYAGRKLMAKW